MKLWTVKDSKGKIIFVGASNWTRSYMEHYLKLCSSEDPKCKLARVDFIPK
jgi:hypothetical protein